MRSMPLVDLLRIAGEFLAQRQRRGILGVGAADLDDVRPRFRLVVQRVAQLGQRGDQPVMNFLGAGDVHGRGIGVVGRLAHIDVVVGMDRLFRAHLAAQHLDGAVGDHLIGVHVGLRARAGLPHHQREMIVELAVDHLLGGGDDGFAELGVEAAQAILVSAAARLTMPSARTTGSGLLLPADLEIAEGALRLRAPIVVGWPPRRGRRCRFRCGSWSCRYLVGRNLLGSEGIQRARAVVHRFIAADRQFAAVWGPRRAISCGRRPG